MRSVQKASRQRDGTPPGPRHRRPQPAMGPSDRSGTRKAIRADQANGCRGARRRLPNACPVPPARHAPDGQKAPAPARASGEMVDRAGVERSTSQIVNAGPYNGLCGNSPFQRESGVRRDARITAWSARNAASSAALMTIALTRNRSTSVSCRIFSNSIVVSSRRLAVQTIAGSESVLFIDIGDIFKRAPILGMSHTLAKRRNSAFPGIGDFYFGFR